MQYNLWFILFMLLIVPFLPLYPTNITNIFSKLISFKNDLIQNPDTLAQVLEPSKTIYKFDQISDFAISISSQTPSFFNIALLSVWILGMIVMVFFVIRSWMQIYHIKQSALPVQSKQVQKLFSECMYEMNIKRQIPIYSTMFLTSPITVGFFKPKIYIPLQVISDFNETDMRYMLLHELQHYRHKDTLINYIANFAGIIYWFNPFIWYALKELRLEREIACDASVLQMLDETDYVNYGNTLINFAEKISNSPFPFATGIGGNITQIKRRILNIADFRPQSFCKKIRGAVIYVLIATLLLAMSPILSIFAMEQDRYTFNDNRKNITYLDLSATFQELNGSFVLYDTNTDTWTIYNKDFASKRITPNSTYKIYDALLGLELGIISPERSTIAWNGKDYPFDAWESNQDLSSAMQNSVNWYFQTIDSLAGADSVNAFLLKIGYGNQTVGNDLEMYWTDFSLKISPIEQVELLKKFYNNEFRFQEQNITAVKNAICLATTPASSLYGKTGTGRVDGQDVNGWFIGYIEKDCDVYYFATNIQGNSNASGSAATKITQTILSELKIWE